MKKAIKSIIFLVSALTLAESPLFSAFSSSDAGTAGGQFLKFSPGARNYAMAEASLYSSQGAESVNKNPAGIVSAEKTEILFSYSSLLEGINYNGLVFSKKSAENAFAFYFQKISYGEITTRDIYGADTGDISPSDKVFAAVYAKEISKNIKAGVSVKKISSDLGKKASSFAADLGLKYDLNKNEGAAFALSNIGGGLKYEAKSDPLPLLFSLGYSRKIYKTILETDLYLPSDNSPWLAFGGEYEKEISKNTKAYLRCGYRGGMRKAGGLGGMSIGLGLDYYGYSFSYSHTFAGDLSSFDRFSFSVKF